MGRRGRRPAKANKTGLKVLKRLGKNGPIVTSQMGRLVELFSTEEVGEERRCSLLGCRPFSVSQLQSVLSMFTSLQVPAGCHWAVWGLALLLLGGLLGAGPGPAGNAVQETVRVRFQNPGTLLSAGRAASNSVRATDAVARVYRRTGGDPRWITSSGPTAQADSLLAVLRDADRDGLRPSDYHIATLDSLRNHLRRVASGDRPVDERQLADFELLCTDAFLLYGRHLLQGRVAPEEMVPTWTLDRRQGDLVQRLDEAVEQGTIRSALDDLRPKQAGYHQLRRALQRYRDIAEAGGWPTVPDGPKLEVGVDSDQVEALRARLRATGELTADASEAPRSFDDSLRAAVVQFQERHGLEADGVVGPASRAALNVPVDRRIQQLEVNLERWRWLPQDLGTRHVRVNIAGFQLRVMEEGAEQLKMRVVTGRPYRQTPIFSDQISYLAFSPYWNVPHSLATRDKLPEFQRTPGLVSQQGFEVFQGWGADARRLDPAAIDWASLSARNFPYRLRQRPGPQNALGQVKFMFPNRHSVYLHDTPSQALFQRSARGFSSGCIRVERPVELATYLLRANEGWTPERVRRAMGQSQEQTVVLREKVPVHLLYWTAWEEDGQVQFRNDIYQRDGAVASALDAVPPDPRNRPDAGGARWSP